MNRRASDDVHTSGAGEQPETMLEKGRQQTREAARLGREQLEAGAGRAAGGVGDFAEALDSAAGRLSELHHEGLADYTKRLSSQLSEWSGHMQNKNIDELAGDVRRLAERNPALFLLGAVALGIGLSRFAKASGERYREDDRYRTEDRYREEDMGGNSRWRGSDSRIDYEAELADYTDQERAFVDGATEPPPATPDPNPGSGGTGS